MQRTLRSIVLFSAAAVLIVAAPTPAAASQECHYEFVGNSAASQSSQDLTCSTLADNIPGGPGGRNDVGIGAGTCADGSYDCVDGQACLCAYQTISSDFVSYLEFVVQCRSAQEDCSQQVALDRLEWRTQLFNHAHDGKIDVYRNTDGFVSWELVESVDITEDEFTIKTVDLTSLEPACKVAFRLVPTDRTAGPPRFFTYMKNLKVFGDCVVNPGPTDDLLATGAVRVPIGQQARCVVTNASDDPVVVDDVRIFDSSGAIKAQAAGLAIPAKGHRQISAVGANDDFHCEATKVPGINVRLLLIQSNASVDGAAGN